MRVFPVLTKWIWGSCIHLVLMLSCAITLSCICLAFFFINRTLWFVFEHLVGKVFIPRVPNWLSLQCQVRVGDQGSKRIFHHFEIWVRVPFFFFFFFHVQWAIKCCWQRKKNKAEVCSIQQQWNIHVYFHVPWYSTFYSLLEKPTVLAFVFSFMASAKGSA